MHACTQCMVPGRGVRGGDMRISDELRVSTDTVWVLPTVSVPRMSHSIVAVVVLSDSCLSGAASCVCDTYLQ